MDIFRSDFPPCWQSSRESDYKILSSIQTTPVLFPTTGGGPGRGCRGKYSHKNIYLSMFEQLSCLKFIILFRRPPRSWIHKRSEKLAANVPGKHFHCARPEKYSRRIFGCASPPEKLFPEVLFHPPGPLSRSSAVYFAFRFEMSRRNCFHQTYLEVQNFPVFNYINF